MVKTEVYGSNSFIAAVYSIECAGNHLQYEWTGYRC